MCSQPTPTTAPKPSAASLLLRSSRRICLNAAPKVLSLRTSLLLARIACSGSDCLARPRRLAQSLQRSRCRLAHVSVFNAGRHALIHARERRKKVVQHLLRRRFELPPSRALFDPYQPIAVITLDAITRLESDQVVVVCEPHVQASMYFRSAVSQGKTPGGYEINRTDFPAGGGGGQIAGSAGATTASSVRTRMEASPAASNDIRSDHVGIRTRLTMSAARRIAAIGRLTIHR